jgi:hypothetical protein
MAEFQVSCVSKTYDGNAAKGYGDERKKDNNSFLQILSILKFDLPIHSPESLSTLSLGQKRLYTDLDNEQKALNTFWNKHLLNENQLSLVSSTFSKHYKSFEEKVD